MTLDTLLEGVEVVRRCDANPPILRVSRAADFSGPDTLFVACQLPWARGRDDVRRAAENRAAAIVVDENDPRLATAPASAPLVVARHVNQAYATVCANLFGNAQRHLRFYGVTGTKGKTTTCHLVESILRAAGHRTGLISTLVQRIGRREIPNQRTTPDPCHLHKILAKMHAAGVTHVVLEVSSIALAEDRLHGIAFDGVLLTNLGHDHLDYHGGLEPYKAAKARLFTDAALHAGRMTAAVNADDAFGVELAERARGTIVTYGIERGDVRPDTLGVAIESSLVGRHNLYNMLGAIAVLRGEVSGADIAAGVRDVDSLPGHFERVTTPHAGGDVDVFVDYAHTPESVQAVLAAAASVAPGRRRVVVVGCRGGSDRAKRVPIAEIAMANADVCILTSNNPTIEDPQQIIRDMVNGLPVEELVRAGRLEMIVDRREAIFRAVEAAQPGGVVMVLGRGAQPTQAIGACDIPFDDREVARAALAATCGPAAS